MRQTVWAGLFAVYTLCALEPGCGRGEVKWHEGAAGQGAVANTEALSSGCASQSYGGHNYLFCTSDKSWDSARTDCQNRGMDLVRIDDANENEFVRSHLSTLGNAWIGGSDKATEGSWLWAVDGTQFWSGNYAGTVVGGRYTKWSALQPDDLLGAQDCGKLAQIDGTWSDEGCSSLYDYVCENTPPPPPPSSAPQDTSCWDAKGLQSEASWPMRGLCPFHRGATKFIGSQVNTVNWVYQTGAAIRSSAAVAADGTVYFGSDDFYVYALNSNGTLKWRYHTNNKVRSSPVLGASGALYVGSEDGYVYALDIATGTLKWRTNTSSAVDSSPAIGSDGTVYVGSHNGNVYAFDPSTGAVLWSYQTGSSVDSSPSIGTDGTIYIGSDDHFLYALKPDLGLTSAQRLRWKSDLGSDINSIPTVGPGPDHLIYVRTQVGRVYRLDPATGSSTAVYTGPSDVDTDSSTAIGLDGSVYVGIEHKVFAFGADLSLKWTRVLNNDVKSSPTVGADGIIYIGADDQRVYALKPGDGSVLWSLQSTGLLAFFRPTPAIGKNGAVYIGGDDKKLYSIGTFACSPSYPCANGQGPCTADTGCAAGLNCGQGIAAQFGLPDDFGVCWNPGGCLGATPPACGGFRSTCGTCDPGCSGTAGLAAGSPWPMQGQCPQQRSDGALNLSTTPTVLWSFDFSGGTQAEPVIGADGAAYFGGDNGVFYVLNRDATVRWSIATGNKIVAGAALAATGDVYFGSLDGHLYAANANTGQLSWTFTGLGAIAAAPLIGPDGTVYVGDTQKLYALEPVHGTSVWSLSVGAPVMGAIALSSDASTLYFNTTDRVLHAVSAQYPYPFWQTNLETAPTSAPAVGPTGDIYDIGGTFLYQYAPDGKLVAGEGTQDSTPWQCVRFGRNGSIIKVSQSTFYYQYLDRRPIWSKPAHTAYQLCPAITKSGIYTYDGPKICAIRETDGVEQGCGNLPSTPRTPVVVDVSRVFTGLGTGIVVPGQCTTNGDCKAPNVCSNGQCVCVPNCAGILCGQPDGCGGTCTTGSGCCNPSGPCTTVCRCAVGGGPCFGDAQCAAGISCNPLTQSCDVGQRVATTCTGASGLDGAAPWPIEGECSQRLSLSAFPVPGSLNAQWDLSDGSGRLFSAPALDEGGVTYVGSADGRLYAIDHKGKVIWATAIGGPIASTPTVLPGGRVAITTVDGFVNELNTATGSSLWSVQLASGTKNSLLPGSDGTLMFGDDAGVFHALRADTGAEVWSYATGSAIQSSAVLLAQGSLVAFGSNDHHLYVLRTGTVAPQDRVLTSATLTAEVDTTPVAPGDQNNLYVVTRDDLIHRFDYVANTTTSASFVTLYGGALPLDPDLPASRGLAVSAAGTIRAFSARAIFSLFADLTVEWTFTANQGVTGLVDSADGASCYSDALGGVHCLDIAGVPSRDAQACDLGPSHIAAANACWVVSCPGEVTKLGTCPIDIVQCTEDSNCATNEVCSGGACVCPNTCGSKQCGHDACGHSCGQQCNEGQTGCESHADCAGGTRCMSDGVCRNPDCESLLLNPCADPANAGQVTNCGPCPECVPECGDRQCGVDPKCGQLCGSSPGPNQYCDPSGRIQANATFDIPLPDVSAGDSPIVGTLPGSFAVSDVGQATYTIPISVPPGRRGIQPELTLTYSGGSSDGYLGRGWGLNGLSAIQRCAATLAQDGAPDRLHYDSTDHFCLDGTRLVAKDLTATYGANGTEYRTETDPIAKIISYGGPLQPDYFKVWTRDGNILTYQDQVGGNFNIGPFEIYAPNIRPLLGNVKTQTWALTRVEDRTGNFMEIQYEASASEGSTAPIVGGIVREYLPKRIIYTGHASTNGNREVEFVYARRNDPFYGYASGIRYERTQILSKLITRVRGKEISEYRFDYTAPQDVNGRPVSSDIAKDTLLNTVTYCARASVTADAIVCMRPTTFTYEERQSDYRATPNSTDQASDFQLGATWNWVQYAQDFPGASAAVAAIGKPLVLDVDGNGRQDLLLPVCDEEFFPSGGSTNFLPTACKQASWKLVLNGNHDTDASGTVKTSNAVLTRKVTQGFDGNFAASSVFLFDYNLDGRDDVVEVDAAYGGGVRVWTYDSASDQFRSLPAPSITITSSELAATRGQAWFADVDGDQVPDLITCTPKRAGTVHYPTSGYEWTVYSNSPGSGLGAGLVLLTPSQTAFPAQQATPPCDGAQPIDIDGDGKEEVLLADGRVFWPEGAHVSKDPALDLGHVDFGTTLVMDTNGDGLRDVVRVSGSKSVSRGGLAVELWTNTGTGFVHQPKQTLPVLSLADSDVIRGIEIHGTVGDYNMDGRADIVFRTGASDPRVGSNDTWGFLTSLGDHFEYSAFPSSLEMSEQFILYDRNGDGAPDLVNKDGLVQLKNGVPESRLKSVTTGLGARTEVQYAFIGQERDQYDATFGPVYTNDVQAAVTPIDRTCAYPTYCRAPSTTVVRRHVVWDHEYNQSENETRSYLYSYAGAATDMTGRGFLGFGQRNISDVLRAQKAALIDPGAGTHLINLFYENTFRDSVTKSYPRVGRVSSRRELVTSALGRSLVTELSRTLGLLRTSPKSYALTTDSEHTVTYEESSTMSSGDRLVLHDVTQTSSYDFYANVTQAKIEWSQPLDANPAHEFEQVDTTFMWTDTSNAYEQNWLIRAPKHHEARSGGFSFFVRSEDFEYYDSGPLSLTGLVHRQILSPDNATWTRTTEFGHDEFGNVVSSTTTADTVDGPQTRTKTAGYDADGIFVASTRDANNHDVHLRVDEGLGVPIAVQEEGRPGEPLTSYAIRNGFGQPISLRSPGEPDVTFTYSNEVASTSSVTVTQDGRPTVKSFRDVLGRPYFSTVDGFSGGSLQSSQNYDLLGQVKSVSRPHDPSVTDASQLTGYDYDALGRLISVQTRDGKTTQACFRGNVICSVDFEGNISCDLHDQRGRLRRNLEPTDLPAGTTSCDAAANYVATNLGMDTFPDRNTSDVGTRYYYEGYGNPYAVVDAEQNVTSYEHDAYGQLMAFNDPDRGRWEATYNGFGELETEKDAKGDVSVFRYDVLGRTVERRDLDPGQPNNGTGSSTSRVWDVGFYGTVDHESTGDNVGTQYTYDAIGRIERVLRTIPGTSSTEVVGTTLAYDPVLGRLQTVTQDSVNGPDFVIEQQYTPTGYLKSVGQPGAARPFWEQNQVDLFGAPQQETFGNGLTTNQTYEPLTGFLHELITPGVQNWLFSQYDGNGHLKERINRLGADPVRTSYGYDPLLRLSSVTTERTPAMGSPELLSSEQMTYTPAGNLLTREVFDAPSSTEQNWKYIYGGSGGGPHAVTSLLDRNQASLPEVEHLGYDQDGALQGRTGSWRGGLSITQNRIHRPASTTRDGLNFTYYGYDPAGDRVYKLSQTAQREFFYSGGYYRVRSTSSSGFEEHFIVSGPPGAVAEVVRDTIGHDEPFYLHPDHLGSIEAVTDQNQVVKETRQFDAFGKVKRSGTPVSVLGYTGAELDDESDLVNLSARLYDPALGRFMSADPLTGIGSGSQASNPYSYALNNPIAWTDPSGLEAWLPFGVHGTTQGTLMQTDFLVPGVNTTGWHAAEYIEMEETHVVVVKAATAATKAAFNPFGVGAETNEEAADIALQGVSELGEAGGEAAGTSGAAAGAGAASGEALSNASAAALAGAPSSAAASAGLATAQGVATGIGIALAAWTLIDLLTAHVAVPIAGGAQAAGAAVERGAVVANSITSHLVDRLQTVAEGVRDSAAHYAATIDTSPDSGLMITLNVLNGYASNSASWGLGHWAQDKLGLSGILDENAISYHVGSLLPAPTFGGPGVGVVRNVANEGRLLSGLRKIAGAVKEGLPGGMCFTAGTFIATSEGPVAIEDVRVGNRVLTRGEDQSSETAVAPYSWRLIHLQMPNPDGSHDVLDIQLLRPVVWAAQHRVVEGASIDLMLEEMGIEGHAIVMSVEPCPNIKYGSGRVVLSTVTHLNGHVLELRFDGSSIVLQPTASHRLFSADRNAWILASQLQPGERLRTAHGSATVTSIVSKPGVQRVYNLEVEAEHSYLVSQAQILSHNMCASPRNLKDALIEGFKLSNHAYRKSVLGRGATEEIIAKTIRGAREAGTVTKEVGAGKFAGNSIEVFTHNGVKVVTDSTRGIIMSIQDLSKFHF